MKGHLSVKYSIVLYRTRSRTPPGLVKTRSGDIARFKQYFKNNDMKHLREASRDLGMSKTTLWRILRVDLKWKAYKPSIGHVLTETDKDRRLAACQWFINQPEEFFEKQVIFSDEKYFVLQQGPNKQNDQSCAPTNPHKLEACKIQGGKKAMCWTGLVDGKVQQSLVFLSEGQQGLRGHFPAKICCRDKRPHSWQKSR